MSKTLDQSVAVVNVAEIRRHGECITVPDSMKLGDAVDVLQRRIKYEEEAAVIHRDFDVHPYDGAHALFQVIRRRFGFAENITQWGFFGPQLPALMTVPTGFRTSVQVPWGAFRLPPQIGGTIEPSVAKNQKRLLFRVSVTVKRMHEKFVQELLQEVADYLQTDSIYRGKAVSLSFFDEDKQPYMVPEPKFMDVESVDESLLVFNHDTEAAIATNLFTPIDRLDDLVANGEPIRRSVLLAGTFGTGKTLTALVAAKKAQQAGITYIYIKRAMELAAAIRFSVPYSSPAVVVFCEDVDSATSGERDDEMNEILNTVDGIDTKELNLITLATTNYVEQITEAMRRPGRLDAIIEIPPPDAIAVQKLLRNYGAGVIPPNADLTEVGDELAGTIPAVIREVVKRAKLAQIRRQPRGTLITEISAEALLESARTIRAQRHLLGETEPKVTLPAIA
jgi:transitional endoplasmic reticulum ATPase